MSRSPSSSSHWHSRPRPSRLRSRRASRIPTATRRSTRWPSATCRARVSRPARSRCSSVKATRWPSATCATTASRRRKWRPGRLRRRSTRWPSATCRTRASRPARSRCSSVRATRSPSATCATTASRRLRRRSSAHLPVSAGLTPASAPAPRSGSCCSWRARAVHSCHPSQPQATRRERLSQGRVGPPTRRRDEALTGPRLVLGGREREESIRLTRPAGTRSTPYL